MLKNFRLIKNIVSVLSREALNKGALFLMMFFIARILGARGVGRYTLALVMSQIVFFAIEFGLNTLFIRDVSRDKEIVGVYLFKFSVMKLVLGVLGLFIILAASWAMRCDAQLVAIIMACAASYFVINFINLYGSVFRAFQKMEYEFYVSLIKSVIFYPLGLVFLFKGHGILGVFYVFFTANCLGLALMLFYLKKERIYFKPKADFNRYVVLTKETIPLWMSQLLGILFLKVASPFLYVFKGSASVGFYNAGYAVFEGSSILAGGIVTAIFPVLSHQFANSGKEFAATYKKWTVNLVYIFIPLLLLLFIIADRVVTGVYGVDFRPSVFIFRVLTAAAFFQVINVISSMAMVSMNRQWLLVLIMGAGMALNAVLCAFLIPARDFNGAGFSLLISEIVVLFLLLFSIKKVLTKSGPQK